MTTLDGEPCYRIASSDRMPPFLVSVASDSDLWMWVSSAGGVTAGRGDPDGALFPYETADRLLDGHHHTGPVTLLRVTRGGAAPRAWEPFAARPAEPGPLERNLYKNVPGNRLVFEEIHHGLGLAFRYRWSACDAFGLVRTATLENRGAEPVTVELLDGLRNVLPHGAPLAIYQRSSVLVDAYKRVDCDAATRLGVFSLTSRITDRAEAVESLRANAVWCCGLPDFEVRLSLESLDAFRRGEPLPGERVLTGRRGNYFVVSRLALPPAARAGWHLVADVGRSHADLAALRARLLANADPAPEVESALDEARDNLRRIVAASDGLQVTGGAVGDAHHFANVLFNVMRGGVFATGHDVPAGDFREFARARHRRAAARHPDRLEGLPDELPVGDLHRALEESGDPDLQRLGYEYLPLYFGRRHGDPSRPWNRFAIRVRDAEGHRALQYEGNWRDIFQNWEGLAVSFPAFLPSLVAKFVNASTVDGFNPYRISRDGLDWEVVDPHDPWSYIGYWGDHQIVYLSRLLEALARVSPGTLEALLEREIFGYADVPYRLKPYAAIVADPRATIDFDDERAARVAGREGEVGADGRLVHGPDGEVLHVTLFEKLLVPVLAKLSNLVPDGGIWMNTQRPEWNDANNALAGHGVSVVTLCHLRRHLAFLEPRFAARGAASAPVSTEVVAWLRAVRSALERHRDAPAAATGDGDRRRLLDALGAAFSEYRAAVYARGFSGREALPYADAAALCRVALGHLDRAIRANRRDDGLYHAYNVLEPGGDGAGAALGRLDEMLEGQVAALSSGLVGPEEAVRIVEALFASRLYCPVRRSFLLYPARGLPAFLEKNVVPEAAASAVPLVRRMHDAGERSILERDAAGAWRFHGDLGNASDLAAALDRLARREDWSEAVAAGRAAVLDLFERVFRHRSFTGRSGSMYGYEGLGCVYWHMVAKLLLAVQELVERASDASCPAAVVEALAAAYGRIRGGLGFEKTASEWGAFPTDPYSHTPAHAGAQQPGMTGQVKEEILTRFGELGVRIVEGTVRFRPLLLGRDEFRAAPARHRFVDLDGSSVELEVPAGALAFTLCQVPVIYRRVDGTPRVRVIGRDGSRAERAGDALDAAQSCSLLERRGAVARIEVDVPGERLRGA